MLFDPPAELPVNLAFLILAKKLPDTFLSLKSILSPPFPLFAGIFGVEKTRSQRDCSATR